MRKYVLTLIAFFCVPFFLSRPIPATAETFTHEMGKVTFETPPKRILSSNWGLTETIIALGLKPVGVPDPQYYGQWVAKPPLPDDYIDIGQRATPNFEAIRKAKPDLIVISKDAAMAYDAYSAIAPTMVISVYNNNTPALASIRKAVTLLGKVTHREDRARELLAKADATFKAAGERVRAVLGKDQKIAVIRINTPAMINVFGPQSLPNTVLDAMGVKTAYNGPVSSWGFARGGLEILRPFARDAVVYLDPMPPAIRQQTFNSPLWKVQGFVRNHKTYELPPVWTYGGIFSATRFAEELATTIENGADQ